MYRTTSDEMTNISLNLRQFCHSNGRWLSNGGVTRVSLFGRALLYFITRVLSYYCKLAKICLHSRKLPKQTNMLQGSLLRNLRNVINSSSTGLNRINPHETSRLDVGCLHNTWKTVAFSTNFNKSVLMEDLHKLPSLYQILKHPICNKYLIMFLGRLLLLF